MRNISLHGTCREALGLASLETLFDRRQAQTDKMFQDFSINPDHKSYRFLPEPNKCIFNLRNSQRYHVPICKTNRLKNSCFSTAIVYRRFYSR